jgi:hypothetical protein
MSRLVKRWYVWLGLVLLLGLGGSVALIWSSQGRITRGNFERIQNGMSYDDIAVILGDAPALPLTDGKAQTWRNGPNRIDVAFVNGYVLGKRGHFANSWETLRWYAKKGAEKIGVKWD